MNRTMSAILIAIATFLVMAVFCPKYIFCLVPDSKPPASFTVRVKSKTLENKHIYGGFRGTDLMVITLKGHDNTEYTFQAPSDSDTHRYQLFYNQIQADCTVEIFVDNDNKILEVR